jgi:autotransporter-associated beta strand protein
MNMFYRSHFPAAKLRLFLFAALATLLSSTALHAGDYWAGGSGPTAAVWDTTSSNWINWSLGSNNIPFTNGDTVEFYYSWAPLTVTIPTRVTAGGAIFSGSGYTIASGTLGLSGSWPELDPNAGITATVSSFVDASGSGQYLEQYRPGTLILAGGGNISSYSINQGGTLVLSGGAFSIGGGIAFSANAAVKIAGAAVATSNAYNFLSSGAYNYLGISGGSWSGAAILQGQNSADTGVITQSGGSFNQNTGQPFLLGGFNTAGGVGVFNLDAGTMSVNAPMSVGWDTNTSGRGEFNLNGGSATATEFDFRGTTTGVLNLLSGTLSVATIQAQPSWGYNDANAAGSVNFNGGTLQAAQNGASLINLQTAATQNNVFICGGGATIDTNGNNVTLANGLNAPVGNGVSGIALVNGGSGYNGEPYVQITGGGGSGATARAPINLNGTITGIVVTNPGTGYTGAPSVALVGGTNSGGTTTAATLGTVSTAANACGSLTKSGAGTLTLAATNSIIGNTTINAGVLDLTKGMLYGGLNSGATLTVGPGATLQLAGQNPLTWAGNPGIGNLLVNANYLVINGGTVNFTGTTATGGGRDFTVGTLGATLQSSQSGGILAISGGATGVVANNSSLTLAGNGSGGGVFQSSITGSGSLTKSGSGTWTLTGSNSYTGATTVSAGTLCVNGAIGGTAALTVASGATLSGTGTIAGIVNVGSGASLTLGDGAGNHGPLTLSGTLALAGGATLNFGMGKVGTSDLLRVTGGYVAPSGTVTINLINVQNFTNLTYGMTGGTYNLITGAAGISVGSYLLGSTPTGYTCALSASNGTLSVVVTPPTTAQVKLLGAAPTTSGSAFNYQILLLSNATGYAATGLPAGLTLDASTGIITGTVATPGIYYATVSATNSGGTATSQLLITVPPAKPFVASSNNPPVLLSSSGSSQTVQPVLDNTLLINPGKGFVQYYSSYYANDSTGAYAQRVIGVGYSRWDWSVVEPSEGVFDWSQVDALIADFARFGLKVGFSIMNLDGGTGRTYATPAWVFQPGTNPTTGSVYPAGAQSVTLPDGSVSPTSWEDPVFVARMKEFITAFGGRYNGNPNIAYLDIGDYGNWGESNADFGWGVNNITPAQLQADYYQPYFTAFPDTQLIVNTNLYPLWGNVQAWAVTQGAGVRRDGMCSTASYDCSETLVAYPHAPAALEWGLQSGTDSNTGLAWNSPGEVLWYVTGGRASYVSFFPEFYNANPAFCQMLGNLLGYHFVIQQAVIPTTIQANGAFPLSLTWLNNGVAPIYEPCSVAVALLDANNNVAQKQWLTTSNPKGWMPGVNTTENYNVTFPSVPSGYKLAVGLFAKQTDANPTYRLGIQGRTVTGWYILSGSTDQAAATWTNASGGSWQTSGNWTGSRTTSGADVTADFGTLNLTSNATVTLDGNVTVGNLLFGDTTPSNNWTLNPGTSGTLSLQVNPNGLTPGITVTNGTVTMNAPLTGFLGLTKSGSGTLVLAGVNSFYGNTTINGGVLEIGAGTRLYSLWQWAVVTVNAGATLRVNNWGSYGWNGWGDLDQVPMDDPNILVLNGGTLEFTGTQAASGERAFSIGASGGTLKNSSTQVWGIGAWDGGAYATLINNSSLTLAGTGLYGQVQKSIVGSGSLTKTGAGTWTLTGTNTYTGATSVSAGTLTLGGTISSTASVTVSAGATLNVTGKLYATGNIVNSGTMIFSGASPQFGAGGTITNNGTIINNSPSLTLPTIVNNGTILSVPPSPWVRADIGTVGITGSATYLTGTYTVMGGGAGITGAADAFCYTYQTSSSDCSVVARVASITNTNASAKGGVMIRSTTAANSMEAGVWVTPSSGIIFTYRKTTGGTTSTSSSTGKTAPYWVKITRTGNSFAGYYSTNGTSWTQFGSTQTISMGTSATIGLGVTSNVSGTLCTSKIDNITATP